jgi:hypothetical protein
MEVKPLHPLTYGIVLIAGVKASNLDDEIRNHPRVIMWDSQQEHWHSKDLPDNTRAVFMTRFISHAGSNLIIKQARKRQIPIFYPEGTGLITQKVRELLDLNKLREINTDIPIPQEPLPPILPQQTEEKTTVNPNQFVPKLHPLKEFIDFSKGNSENARVLFKKANELGIETTFNSLAQMVGHWRKKQTSVPIPSVGKPVKIKKEKMESKADGMDVAVEILDNVIKELKDMRQFLVDTTRENLALKTKLNKFKKFFED